MRKKIAVIIAVLLLVAVMASAEGLITASVHVKASRNVYDSVIRTGEDVDMTVDISGFTPVACQWYKGGEPVEGASQTTLHIDSADVSDTAVYRMDAMDETGRVRVSADVALRVVDYSIPKTGDARAPKPLVAGMMAAAAAVALIIRKKAAHTA